MLDPPTTDTRHIIPCFLFAVSSWHPPPPPPPPRRRYRAPGPHKHTQFHRLFRPSPSSSPTPYWMGGVVARITHPIDLTKVHLLASRDQWIQQALQNTVRTAGTRGLIDGIWGTLMQQMGLLLRTILACRLSERLLGAGECLT